jgi:hypothetical protein
VGPPEVGDGPRRQIRRGDQRERERERERMEDGSSDGWERETRAKERHIRRVPVDQAVKGGEGGESGRREEPDAEEILREKRFS